MLYEVITDRGALEARMLVRLCDGHFASAKLTVSWLCRRRARAPKARELQLASLPGVIGVV